MPDANRAINNIRAPILAAMASTIGAIVTYVSTQGWKLSAGVAAGVLVIAFQIYFMAALLRARSSAKGDTINSKTIPENYLKDIEREARANHYNHIRMACFHTIWSYAPQRARPLLEDALDDMSDTVKVHARTLLDALQAQD